jgi:perosamine synthetase
MSSNLSNEATEKLALDGGDPAVPPMPKLVRWDDAERRQLAAMIAQPSLFYWNGPQTKLLLERFTKHYPLKFAMPCSSGTAAIHIALLAAGIGPGDEVITSPITDMGTVIGILYQQGVPVFADLQPHTYNLDPADVARRITPKTKAILAVHLAGNPCAMAELKALAEKHRLILIEDCAQAWGTEYRGKPVGTIGHIGCYSLNDFKHIGCGDGGMVATDDEPLGARLQRCGDKGYDRVTGLRAPEFLAPNYRISEPQSAVAAVQMERLKEITSTRNRLGDLLTREISGLPGIRPHQVDAENVCSYWFYMMRIEPSEISCGRDEFVRALTAEGVPASAGYIPTPLYQYPIFRDENFFAGRWPIKEMGLTCMDYKEVSCPESEAILRTAVKFVIHQAMDPGYILAVAKAIRKVATHFSCART